MLKNDKIEMLPNGNMIVNVSFDVAKHGHNLGRPRNYDMNKYKQMVESDKTKKHINNGYALIFYSHDARSPQKNYLPHEKDKDGSYQLPVGRLLNVGFKQPSTVNFEALILDNPMGKEIQKLIKSGVGGFSLVNNIKDKLLIGADYVLSPNFSSNRVINDETCENGLCSIKLDTITQKIDDELVESVKAFLDDIEMQDDKEVFDAIVSLEKQTDEYKQSLALLDKIETSKAEIEANSYSILDEVDAKYKDEIKELETMLDEIEASKNKIQDSFEDFIENKYKKLVMQLDSLGFELDNDDNIQVTNKSLTKIFVPHSLDDALSQQYEDIKHIKLLKQKNKLDKDKLKKAFSFKF